MPRALLRSRAALAAIAALVPALLSCADSPSPPATPASLSRGPGPAAPRALPAAPAFAVAARRAEAAPFRLTAADGTGLRLVALTGRAVIEAPLALAELHLTFENPEDRVLEGTFSVTLPPGASVGRLAMKIDDRWQEGEVVELQRAREAYEDFLHRKQDPALLEQAAGNEVSARVFPIPARGVKHIVLSYSQELRPGAPFTVPLRGLPTVSRLDIEATVAGAAAPVHALRRNDAAPEADFVVDPARLTSIEGRGGLRSGELVLARVNAPVDARPDPLASAVILVDTSASRALGLEEQLGALAALARAVAQAGGPGAPLTVACYDQAVTPVFDGAASAFGEVEIARIRDRQALGASDLGRALRWAGERARARGQRRVVLLSDGIATAGEVAPGALRGAAAALRGAGVERLDAVALGGLRDEAALRQLVAAGLPRDGAVVDGARGAAEIERRLGSATRSGIAVNIEGARWVWPRTLNGVQPGDEALVYAEVPAALPVRLTVDGRTTTPDLRGVERPLLERSWARAKIDGLLAREGAGGDQDAIRKQIIDLSIAHRVLSPYTALLVLETEHDYARFDIARRGLSDILTVEGGRVAVQRRSRSQAGKPSAPAPATGPVAGASPGERAEVATEQSADVSPGGSAALRPPPAPPAPPAGADARYAFLKEGPAPAGASGLGLSGVGEGGGGRGEGIGLGAIGSIGHGSGAAAPAPSAASATSTGQGFGSGHGRLAGSHRTRAPQVRMGATQVSGRLPPEVIQRIVRQNFGRFRLCYERGLQRDEGLQGRVTVRFTIDPSGALANARDGGSDLPDSATVSCVVRAFRDLTFPAPEGGSVDVVYPILFTPPPDAAPAPDAPDGAAPPRSEPYTGRFKQINDTLARGDAPAAVRDARAWRAEVPGDVLALVALGEALEAAGDTPGAARAYGSLIDLFPARADLRRFAGARLERLAGGAGLELAVDTYEKAREQRPDHPASHRLLAFARLKRGEHAAAFDALEAGIARRYPPGRFSGVEGILREDLGLVAAAWLKAEPARRAAILARLAKAGAALEDAPSLRFVLNWETDANDVDFHIRDDRGGHAYYGDPTLPGGGHLYADVTTGYGPECFTIRAPREQRASRYTLQAHYYARGPMGYGMGKLQIVDHDGKGGLTFDERPFVVMTDGAFVELGAVTR
ncbi:AgmX/PglI C-terminal domain-containing protein [Sorangium atrum]|uniref:AgmX/PglI C-terminal domain-containing protein n=1 Tax=Sorangium atrum TaxID=2995308 RepID=A0ABT5BTP5_9BACT|nr:AgmX/PglI C-terminal domain-containing protein [Sorangium aterium]MDC0677536.1 AgmX/PglI C-terminal domain-containing protein [Sorangium aterium]